MSHASTHPSTGVDPLPMLDHRSGFSVLGRVRSPRGLRWFGGVLLAGFGLLAIALIFLPWQQFVSTTGRVVAYQPLERSVTIEAPLTGRLVRSHVVEGQAVRKGEVLFQLADNDPNLLANLRQQQAAAVERKEAAERRVLAITTQIAELERALPLAVEAAKTRLDAAQFAATTAGQQFERLSALYNDRRGLASQRDYELALLERDRARAELARADAEWRRAEVDFQVTLNSTQASRAAARADVASAEQGLVSLNIQISQTENQLVLAPRDGIILRVQATEGSYLRAGSPLGTLVAATTNRMVEIWINGNDMPLVQSREVDPAGKVLQPGSPVRIQFEGWPALQLLGWPSLAVGTFGGEVVLVDPTDNGKGRFRALVAEKPDLVEKPGQPPREIRWPGERWLRQGVRANGWVLLQRVPLWFEFWRQVNGFPPVVNQELLESK